MNQVSGINNIADYRDNYKDDLFTIFFDRLISLYIKENYDEIHNILIGNSEQKTHNHISNDSKHAKYIDKDTVIPVRVWTDDKTRKYLGILYYVCKDEDTMISLNNKIIEAWLYEMNTVMSRFFYKSRDIECSRDCRLTFKVENNKWSEFISRCDALNITQLNGFKICINDFIEQRIKQHLL